MNGHCSGTGKTYIGLRIVECLLANTSKWPILIVCYTNHALDQFLEGIRKFCKDNELIRIGGKSQCQALEKFNLANIKSAMKSKREVPTFIHRSRNESKFELTSIQDQITKLENDIDQLRDTPPGRELGNIIHNINPQHWYQLLNLTSHHDLYVSKVILNWLGYDINVNPEQYVNRGRNITFELPRLYEEPEMDEQDIIEMEEARFIEMDSDEEEDVARYDNRKHNSNPFRRIDQMECGNGNNRSQQEEERIQAMKYHFSCEAKKNRIMSFDRAAAVSDIYEFRQDHRWDLYRLWIKLYVRDIQNEINTLRETYRNECLRFNGLRKQEDIEIVNKAKIIGMTTTGAAKYRHIIEGTKPKITSKLRFNQLQVDKSPLYDKK